MCCYKLILTIFKFELGTYYILLYGVEAYEGVTVMSESTPVTALENRVPMQGISGRSRSATYFTIDVPDGVETLSFNT